jgi:hypothetical protein
MKAALGFDVLSLFLWLTTTIQGIIWRCTVKRADRVSNKRIALEEEAGNVTNATAQVALNEKVLFEETTWRAEADSGHMKEKARETNHASYSTGQEDPSPRYEA